MDPFKAEAIRLALRKMFQPGSYFSICTVDQCLVAAGIERKLWGFIGSAERLPG